MIDISALNANTIWLKMQNTIPEKNTVRRNLIIELAKILAGILHEESQLPVSSQLIAASQMGDKKRCYIFPYNRDRKTIMPYHECNKNICNEHSDQICKKNAPLRFGRCNIFCLIIHVTFDFLFQIDLLKFVLHLDSLFNS